MTSFTPQFVPAARLKAWLHDGAEIAVFDVRDRASYQRGHIDGAAHLAEDRFFAWTRRLDKAAPVLIYCYHGNASKTYAQMFADFHFTRVFSIDGGYPALEMAFAATEA